MKLIFKINIKKNLKLKNSIDKSVQKYTNMIHFTLICST